MIITDSNVTVRQTDTLAQLDQLFDNLYERFGALVDSPATRPSQRPDKLIEQMALEYEQAVYKVIESYKARHGHNSGWADAISGMAYRSAIEAMSTIWTYATS